MPVTEENYTYTPTGEKLRVLTFRCVPTANTHILGAGRCKSEPPSMRRYSLTFHDGADVSLDLNDLTEADIQSLKTYCEHILVER